MCRIVKVGAHVFVPFCGGWVGLGVGLGAGLGSPFALYLVRFNSRSGGSILGSVRVGSLNME